MADVIRVLEEAIAAVRKIEGGDSKMRLEGFLSTFVRFHSKTSHGLGLTFYQYLALPLPDSAIEVLQSAAKFYKTSYLAWLNYIDILM